jgi:alpha-ribazole phosphatase
MLLTLLRHGEVAGRAQVFRGRTNTALSAHGEAQMQIAAQCFATPPVTALLTSPLQRCFGFAQHYSTQHHAPLKVVEELREIDFGDWEELTPDEACTRDPECFAQLKHDTQNWQPPQGESYLTFRQRVRAAIKMIADIQTIQAADHLGIITHGGVIRALLAEYLQLSATSAARIAVPLAGSCQLWLDKEQGAQLLYLSPTATLAELK